MIPRNSSFHWLKRIDRRLTEEEIKTFQHEPLTCFRCNQKLIVFNNKYSTKEHYKCTCGAELKLMAMTLKSGDHAALVTIN